MNPKTLTPKGNPQTEPLYQSIKSIIDAARRKVNRVVNSAMVDAYWHIGRLIVEHEQKGEKRAEYGAKLLKNLSIRLSEEIGKGFAFVARQKRISTEIKEFYIDLVFYNYHLKCFALIDLKTGELTHQDVGQMDMYVRMFDDLQKGEDETTQRWDLFCARRRIRPWLNIQC